jgi:hypothetical protein
VTEAELSEQLRRLQAREEILDALNDIDGNLELEKED